MRALFASSGLALDLRQALRRLRRSPALVIAALAALGIGGAAVAAVARLAEIAFLAPLPGIVRQEELVNLDLLEPRALESSDVPLATVEELARLEEIFARVAGFAGRGVALRAGERPAPELAIAQFVTRDYFALLGTRPALGRLLDPARPAEPEVVISQRAHRRWFAGDPAVIGKTVELGGRPFTVVGVAPPGFEGTFVGFQFAVYLSIESGRALLPPEPSIELLARLAPGVSIDTARARLAALEPRRSDEGVELAWRARPLDGLDPSIAAGLAALVASLATLALLVLATAAANVGGLLAARAIERKGELAVRSALGAHDRRLFRPLLIEASLLGLAGGAVAIVLTWLALALGRRLVPQFSTPITIDLSPGFATVVAAVGLAWLLGSLAGFAPVAAVGRSGRLFGAVSSGRGSRRTRGLRAIFVVGQLALALVLVAAGLALARGVARPERLDLGFDDAGLSTIDLELQVLPRDNAARLELAAALERRAREQSAVSAAGLLDQQPFAPATSTARVQIDGSDFAPELAANALSPGTLAALGLELVEGRDFSDGDRRDAPQVAIVDRVAAERLWPEGGALGRRLQVGETAVEIVGVTAPVRFKRPWLPSDGQLLRPLAQAGSGRMALVLRSRETAAALERSLIPVLAAAAPELPLDRPVPLDERIALVQLPQRIAARVGGLLSAVAIALAAVGLAGLVARMASERRREFSIRAALGADRRSIVRLVLGEGTRLAAWGALAGLPLAFATGLGLAAVLERVSPPSAGVLLAAAAAVLALALAAAAEPALRASRVAPADILRGE